MRIRNGPFFADILHESSGSAQPYHCIIQRDGSEEVLVWSQERTEEAARIQAETELKRLVEMQSKAAS